MEKIAIGAAQFGMPYGIANQTGVVNDSEIELILNLAGSNGIKTLDTARSYGKSEKAIGNYFNNNKEHSWEIITKISDTKNHLNFQFQDSTKNLSICPSVMLAHSAKLYFNQKFQYELQDAKEKQFIDKIGVSLYSKKEICQVLDSNYKPDVIQMPMNILDTRLYRCGVLSKLFDRGIEIHVRSVFLQGLFYLSRTDLGDSFKDVLPYLEKLKSISTESGLDIAELSLLWLVSLKEVSKVIIGIDNANQLKAHLETLKKNVDSSVFEQALSIKYENENILNPSLWQ